MHGGKDSPSDAYGGFPKLGPTTATLYSVLETFPDNQTLKYIYDFGGPWIHQIKLVGRAMEATDQPSCLVGEGRPGEDGDSPRLPQDQRYRWDMNEMNIQFALFSEIMATKDEFENRILPCISALHRPTSSLTTTTLAFHIAISVSPTHHLI